MAGNTYGFDFLKSQHLDESGQNGDQINGDLVLSAASADVVTSWGAPAADVRNKPDLEKQFDILAFLQAHRGSGCLPPAIIYKATGIDLDIDIKVAEMLQRNPKVRIEMVPDPENPALMAATYSYQAKFSSVRDRASLLAQINRMTSGVPMRDLLDSYLHVDRDLQALVTAGDVLAVSNSEDKDRVLFPRGDLFLVELDGQMSMAPPSQRPLALNGTSDPSHPPGLTATNGNGAAIKQESSTVPEYYMMETDMDPRNQIRRGEAVQVGGQWFRISSAVREGSLSEQPARAQAPLSVVSLIDLSKRNEVDGYIRPLSAKLLPLDGALSQAAEKNIQSAKAARERLQKLAHGRSGGVTGQLLGSHAHAANPTTLALSFAGSAASSSLRRHHASSSSNSRANNSSTPITASQAAEQRELTKVALEQAASDPALSLYSHARRHGCTRDVRDMYLATRPLVPESDQQLHQLLLQHKLMEPGEQMRRPRLKRSSNVDNDGKPKKRRYYEPKKQRMTNTHLEGTEIGAVLARAAETQRQGRSVGDGGM